MSRVAVVDIGTNSTRLLVAEVEGRARLEELERESTVTRLGEGVDRTGRLGDAPQQRVFDVLERYRELIDRHDVAHSVVVMTSAVRDAENGAEFASTVTGRYGLEGRTLSGDEEARLSFLGATAGRDDPDPLLVIDIGGGSTEMIVGQGGAVDFHVSTQVGVVRHTERYLDSDPPSAAELEGLAEDARRTIEAGVPADVRSRAHAAVAVAGTATQCAAIDLELDPYDRTRIEGHRITRERLVEMRDRLASMPLEERRGITGLDPARAPTIVAGTVILLEVLGAFALGAFEASERDILWGMALEVN
jgi:exopolyphosphatase/guanosine-5'-triphosphate,3'-diphosphate pyrophosphatase